ncbi:cache domain-containing protein [Breoghania sp.]|uniref:cache domain-containing protein n=1 Tax=Breoghania sp. TaxID=2065378 RepID=UPI002621C884|nr:cache domain-containing protein [Breoghania sp.]MDJ0930293.1 cache domain-containing protein [Breoghania sp.]
MRHCRIYDQIRLLDTYGMEQVRVNYRNGRAELVPPDELQNKGHCPYFKKGIHMARGDVYVSRFDLNVEHKKIEMPPRPTLRLAQPIFGDDGSRHGLLVLNLNQEQILGLLANRDRNSELGYWLVNRQGYWLYSDDLTAIWGFQLGHDRTIKAVEGLEGILDRPIGGLVETPQGQFAFNRVNLNSHASSPNVISDEMRNIVSAEPCWICSRSFPATCSIPAPGSGCGS